jgi:hypothetical protein
MTPPVSLFSAFAVRSTPIPLPSVYSNPTNLSRWRWLFPSNLLKREYIAVVEPVLFLTVIAGHYRLARLRALTYRGGIDADAEGQTDLADEFGIPPQTSITETRKYAYHRKIERNRTSANHAKKFHGTRCQACDLDFGERYGKIGKGFIEAHHLRPIGTLEEGIAVKYDVAVDFAVLCSNCHRMIHRFADPSDLMAFRRFINASVAND